MNVKITDDCISCGVCVDICPDVFDLGTDYAVVLLDPVPQEYEVEVKDAADSCPTSAIIID